MTMSSIGGQRAPRLLRAAVGAVACLTLPVLGAGAGEPGVHSPWVSEQGSRARLIAGRVGEAKGSARIYAGLEIELDDGWKTYWRNPGSSGVPPRIEFEGSGNLAKAELLFPAPQRFKDRDGDIIGYDKTVVLPVALTPQDPTKPIVLNVAAEFGICREICVPVQPSLRLQVPPDAALANSDGLLPQALARVPKANTKDARAPRLERVTMRLSGDKPRVEIDAVFPGDASKGDVFVEAPDGIWVPLAQPTGPAIGAARKFIIDLTDSADLADLKGRVIRVTLVGSAGQSETSFDLVEAR